MDYIILILILIIQVNSQCILNKTIIIKLIIDNMINKH
jgi:hypothetical protein